LYSHVLLVISLDSIRLAQTTNDLFLFVCAFASSQYLVFTGLYKLLCIILIVIMICEAMLCDVHNSVSLNDNWVSR